MRQRSRALTARRTDLADGVYGDMIGGTFPNNYEWLTAADELSVKSTDAADTSAGVGAQQVELYLLDAAFVGTFVPVVLNGTTSVSIPGGPFYRCNGMRVVQVGSSGIDNGSSGRIELSADTGSEKVARIKLGNTVGFNCIYTIPSNRRILPVRMDVEIHRPKAATAALLTGSLLSRADGETSWNEELETQDMNEENPKSSLDLRDFDFGPGTDIRIRALTDSTLTKAYARLILFEGYKVASP